MSIRRVVTGHDEAGKAIFTADEQIPPITTAMSPGTEFFIVWGADGPPSFPDNGAFPGFVNTYPKPGGFRLFIMTIPPANDGKPEEEIDFAAAVADLEANMPGLTKFGEPDNPGMHTTATIDFEVMISGEVTLELDDGSERILRPGDTLVQNGTRHRWLNRGTEPARFAAFIVGANHAKVATP